MKRALILAMAIGLWGASFAHAGEGKNGPRGGRILEQTSPAAEFFVEKDRTVTIAFYDSKLKPVTPGEQQITVTAGKQKIEFEKKGDLLAGKERLPEGNGYQVIVQYKEKPDAKPQNLRFKMDMSTCGECKRMEYACFCH